MGNIKINNNVPNIEVSVDKTKTGYEISIVEKGFTLGDKNPGDVVTIGKREFIVLGHGKDTTALITKEFAKKMEFGDNGYYPESKVRKYCNGEFYNELCEAVGKENVILHTVDLEADDGTGKGEKCSDYVSIITTKNYRRYRELLEAYGDWWWTANRVTYADKDYARRVCDVSGDGVLIWSGCDYCLGVRPFCILNSSISVS